MVADVVLLNQSHLNNNLSLSQMHEEESKPTARQAMTELYFWNIFPQFNTLVWS